MLTATTRVCTACHLLLPEPPAPQVCSRCGRVAVPPHGEWPKGMKRWLVAAFIRSFWAPHATATEQYRWERLLHAVVAGSTWGDRIVPYASSTMDCFAVAVTHFTADVSLEAIAADPISRSTANAA